VADTNQIRGTGAKIIRDIIPKELDIMKDSVAVSMAALPSSRLE
jgi:hypothetical protein